MVEDIINEITSIEHEVCMKYLSKYPHETSNYILKLNKLFQQLDLYDISKSESD